MKKDFVIRGQTASGETEILEFGGYKEGYAYKLIEFQLWGSTNIGGAAAEMMGSITAGKTAVAPTDPNFNNEGLIGVSYYADHDSEAYGPVVGSVLNDTFMITQNLILMVQDIQNNPINWQCRFVSHKMADAEAAATNFKQFSIFDE